MDISNRNNSQKNISQTTEEEKKESEIAKEEQENNNILIHLNGDENEYKTKTHEAIQEFQIEQDKIERMQNLENKRRQRIIKKYLETSFNSSIMRDFYNRYF